MKVIQFIQPVLLLFCSIACGNNNAKDTGNENPLKDTSFKRGAVVTDTLEAGKVIAHVYCKADASQSYALYIPAKGNREALPVIYFFDPHGDGELPVTKYKSLADLYNFILIGSNNSKNGNEWSANENIWKTMFDDSQTKIKINSNRIYAVGFSGGAKVATYVGLNHPEVNGVIANGAGLPEITSAGNFQFSFTAIAGEGDLNMTDLVAINEGLNKTQTRHRIIFFDGKHEWAPETAMKIAFAGLQLDAMQEKLIPADDSFIGNYIDGSKKSLADELKTNNYIKAETECKLSISLLDGVSNDVNWFKENDASLKSNPVYKKQSEARQNLLVTEQNLKATYVQQFQQGDMNYWKKTINELQANAKVQTDEGAMYQRLLAYLSLAFYSISNQLITGHQDIQAKYFVELYKKVDATNSEAWYFSAIINARSNNAKATEDDLLKAVACGFTDKDRMIQQPEFQNIGSQINFTEIENTMKK